MVGEQPEQKANSEFCIDLIPQEQKHCILQGSSQNKQDDKFSVIVYNYFLDGFPKSYSLAPNDTLYELTTQILNDNKQLKREGIKKFIDQVGRQVSDSVSIASAFPSEYKLQMEIIFNEDIKISNNNKQIEFFMLNQSKYSRNDIFYAIQDFHACEKGGKIIVGVNSEGLIKGETIPDQDKFKGEFEALFRRYLVSTQKSQRILHDIDISFFRVKGQSKLSYKYQDHKKIMIIKIKGTNQHILSQINHFALRQKTNTHCNQQKYNYSNYSSPYKKFKQSKQFNTKSTPFNSFESTEASSCFSSSKEEELTLNEQSTCENPQPDNLNSTNTIEGEQNSQYISFCSQLGENALKSLKSWDTALFLKC